MPNLIVSNKYMAMTIRATCSLSLIVSFLISTSGTCFGQKRDSIYNVNKGFSIITAGQVYSHCNAGLFYQKESIEEENSYYHRILLRPMVSHSLGVRYKSLYQLVDFSYQKRGGEYDANFGHDNLEMTYLGYQVWYDFMDKIDFPLKPLLGLNISYAEKRYKFYADNSWGGGHSYTNNFLDRSKSLFIQLPVGVYFVYRSFFFSCSYNIPVIGWVSGNFSVDKVYIDSFFYPPFKTHDSGDYKGDSANKNYGRMKNIVTFKIGCSLNFRKK